MFKDMIISAWAQPETIFSHQQIEYFPIMASSPFPLWCLPTVISYKFDPHAFLEQASRQGQTRSGGGEYQIHIGRALINQYQTGIIRIIGILNFGMAPKTFADAPRQRIPTVTNYNL